MGLKQLYFIEVMGYGDFDMPYTKAIFYGPEKPEDIIKEFSDIQEKHSCEIRARESSFNSGSIALADELQQKFMDFLKEKDFTGVKTHKVYFSD